MAVPRVVPQPSDFNDLQCQTYLERQERERDQGRWRKFLEFARQKDEAASVRRLLVELKAQAQPEGQFGGRFAVEWLTWAEQWLENFDPLLR